MTDLVVPKGKVLIRKHEPKAVTDSGIILRASDRARSFTGEVVTGSDQCKPGDKIIFIPRVSSTVNYRDENLVMISESDIMGTYD